jgi:hypothetical protein
MRHTAVALSVMTVLLFLTAPVTGDEIVKHSGVIVGIADDGRTFVLAEVGPWQIRDGATVRTNRTIRLLPETTFAMVGRADDAPSGFPGDFIEVPLGPEAVYVSDYVTVECRHEGKKMFALKITVTELPDAETAGQTLR